MNGPRSRRMRFGARAAIIVLAVTLAGIALNMVASKRPRRIDVTAWGDQGLSERSRRALDRIKGESELVLAGPWSSPDGTPDLPTRAARRQVFDLLQEMDRTSGPFTFTPLDTLTSAGQQQYAEVLERLALRERGAIAAANGELDRAAAALATIADSLATWSGPLEAARDAMPGGAAADAARRGFENRAAAVRIMSAQIRQRRAEARTKQNATMGVVPVGAMDEAAAILRASLEKLDVDLAALETDLRTAPVGELPEAAAAPVRGIAADIGRQRAAARQAADDLSRLKRPDVLRVARLLESGPAAIIIGPPELGLTAISLDALFPESGATEAGLESDFRRHAEDVVTTALTTLANPIAPIIVVMHAEGSSSILDSGAFDAVRGRLELRRCTFVEWKVTESAGPPPLTAVDPEGKRPVVFVAIGTDGSSSLRGDAALSGPARVAALGRALQTAAGTGRPILLSITPSTAPFSGGVDEAVSILADFGLRADSARPLLAEMQSPQGRQVEAVQRVQAIEGDHPLLQAVRGLPMQLKWAVPLSTLPGNAHVSRMPLFEVDRRGAWAEAEWIGLWRFFREERVDVAAGAGLPTPTEGIDDRQGPWVVGYLAERSLPESHTQRLIVMGANGWFFDSQTLPVLSANGQTLLANPGNSEFFDAAISWLAGQEELIAPGPTARAVARIQAISPGRVELLGWLLIAGVPAGVLGLGVVLRLIRG